MKGNNINGMDPDHSDMMAGMLQQHGERTRFKNELKGVADAYHNQSGQGKDQGAVIIWWNTLKINAVAAACIAIITAFSTLWLSGYYKNMEKNSTNYRELRRDMNTVKQNVNAQNRVINDISGGTMKPETPNNFGATGFLLSADGYVVTNHHVITDADSIHLQNSKGESFKARVIHTDPAADLAILQIEDSTFQRMKPTPYILREINSELGEDVYTLGFPRDEAVYGQGYLSSMSGYSGDTSAYQISIPLNPGNSGGPLLDNRGNLIGIISGKQAGLDGTSFAIKTKTLLSSIAEIPEDALENNKLSLAKKNQLAGLPRTEQIKLIQDYVFMVKVF